MSDDVSPGTFMEAGKQQLVDELTEIIDPERGPHAEVTALAIVDHMEDWVHLPPGMTPEKLRSVANTLELLSRFVADALRPYIAAGAPEGHAVTVTFNRSNGEPMGKHEAQVILDWVEDTEMQDELRDWARQASFEGDSEEESV